MSEYPTVTVSGWSFSGSVMKHVIPQAQNLSSLELFGQAAPPAHALAGKLNGPSNLIGWSLGGMIALELAATQPECVRALVLLNSTSRFCSDAGYPAGIEPSQLKTLIAGFPLRPAYALTRFYEFTGMKIDPAAARQLAEAALDSGKRPLRAGLEYLRDTDLRDKLSAVQCPVLLVHTYDDPVIPADASRYMATKFSNCQLLVMPGSQHASFMQDPETTSREVTSFLESA